MYIHLDTCTGQLSCYYHGFLECSFFHRMWHSRNLLFSSTSSTSEPQPVELHQLPDKNISTVVDDPVQDDVDYHGSELHQLHPSNGTSESTMTPILSKPVEYTYIARFTYTS